MTTRSIIDIEIRDKAWKEFQSSFEKYRSAVAVAPKAVEQINKAIKTTIDTLKQTGKGARSVNTEIAQTAEAQEKVKSAAVESAKSFAAISKISSEVTKNTKRASVESQKFSSILRKISAAQEKIRISAVGTGKVFGKMAKSTGTLAKNIKAVTLDLLRWASLTSVFSGLLGAGGLFGLDRLAASVGGTRREAQGLGVSSGELQAARINYQKLVDVDSMLSKINEAKQDVTKRYAFSAAGLRPEDWENRNAADILKTLVPQIKNTMARGDGSKQYADAMGLTQFVDLETLNRLKSVTQEEIDAAQASYEADKKTLSLNEQTQRAWQNFQIQLTRAGNQIELSFVRGLTGLTGPLSKLSAAVAHAVDVFLSSPKIGEWVAKIGSALESFAKYLTSDDLEHDIKSFLEAVDVFAGSLWSVAKTIGKVFNFGNEQGLKASQYRKLEELDRIDHNAAKALEHALKNPTATAENRFSAWSLSRPGDDLADALKNAKQNPRAAELIKALQDNTEATKAVIPAEQRVKSQINFASLRGDKIALKAEADRQWREAFGTNTPVSQGSNKFADLEKQYGLPAGLLASVEKQESRGNPNARSPVGAEGAFQFMPAAWKQYGAGGDIHSEADSAKAAAKYYRDLLDKFHGDLPKALAGYNWGAGNVDKYGLDRAPEETRNYIAKIIADMNSKRAATGGDAASLAGAATAPSARQTMPPAQNVAVYVYKEAGADVNVTANALGYAN